MDFKSLYEATMATVGCVQGLYMRFMEENDNNENLALKLTEIAWYGLMKGAKKEGDE